MGKIERTRGEEREERGVFVKGAAKGQRFIWVFYFFLFFVIIIRAF